MDMKAYIRDMVDHLKEVVHIDDDTEETGLVILRYVHQLISNIDPRLRRLIACTDDELLISQVESLEPSMTG